MKRFRTFLFCACGFLALGCSSARVLQTSGGATPVGKVAEVQVSAKPGALKSDREERYRVLSMDGAIRSAVMDELKATGKSGEPGAVIDFSVTDFRLRSGGAMLNGVLAGSDYVSGIVTVKDGERTLKTFEAGAKGYDSLWSALVLWRLTAGRRADHLCRLIARQLAEQL